MNAALQNIAAVAPLTSYLMGDAFHDGTFPRLFLMRSDELDLTTPDRFYYSELVDETRSRRVSGSYRMFLDELFGQLNSTYLSAVMPSRLLYAIRLAHPIFRGFHQHDSQEFLRLFMDTLATETKVPHFSFEETPPFSENQDCEHGTYLSIRAVTIRVFNPFSLTSFYQSLTRSPLKLQTLGMDPKGPRQRMGIGVGKQRTDRQMMPWTLTKSFPAPPLLLPFRQSRLP